MSEYLKLFLLIVPLIKTDVVEADALAGGAAQGCMFWLFYHPPETEKVVRDPNAVFVGDKSLSIVYQD